MVRGDIIQHSKRPLSSPMVLVENDDGTLRFRIYYRRLSNVTKRHVYPLPRIYETLDRLPCGDDNDAFLDLLGSDTFAQDQRTDPHLRCVLEYLEGKADSPAKACSRAISSLCLRNDVFVTKNFAPYKVTYLLVVPPNLRQEILEASHDELAVEHMELSWTLRRIQEKYHWPGLNTDVALYEKTS